MMPLPVPRDTASKCRQALGERHRRQRQRAQGKRRAADELAGEIRIFMVGPFEVRREGNVITTYMARKRTTTPRNWRWLIWLSAQPT